MGKEVTFDFSSQRFVVLGASSGLGQQIASEIIECGGTILAIARNKERLDALKQGQNEVYTAVADVRDRIALESVIKDFAESHGKFHGSVYTAGISKTTVLKAFSEEDAKEIMDINFWGWINIMNILCKKRYTEDGCSHVVISSVSPRKGESGAFAYNASKASIDTGVRTFAKELAKRKCRVNSISPGFVDTGLSDGYFSERGFSERIIKKHLLGLGKAEDVSGLALFLLSERAGWMTGTDIVIDGGYLVSD